MNLRHFRAIAILAPIVLSLGLPAQASGPDEGRKAVNSAAATRSLERAVSFLSSGQWDSASFEATLGRSYDQTIADFQYIEAVSVVATGGPRADAINRLEAALGGGLLWRSYDRTTAVLLCARLYAETLKYREALDLVATVPESSSSDQDYVRVMSLYALGRIAEARASLSRSLERWPFDARFPRAFFRYENGTKPDSAALAIARTVSQRLYLWENEDRELLLLSVPFESSAAVRERNIRIFRGMGARDSSDSARPVNPLSTVLALEYGLIDDGAAMDEVLSLSGEGIPSRLLVRLCTLLGSRDARDRMAHALENFAGILIDDANGDGIIDSTVRYRMGRAYEASFDRDQDGYVDYGVSCELGSPVVITLARSEGKVSYDGYPFARSVERGGREYTMHPRALSWAPVTWVDEGIALAPKPFYGLRLSPAPAPLTERLLVAAAAYYTESLEDSSFVRVTLDAGKPIVSETRARGMPYERTIYEDGVPSGGSRDEDGDGYFETVIEYAKNGAFKLVSVDRNANRRYEYRERHEADGTVSKQWDSNEDGAYEITWRRSPDGAERTDWTHPVTGKPVVILVDRGNPRSVEYSDKVSNVLRDPAADVWWIGAIPPNSNILAKAALDFFNRSQPSVVSQTITASGRSAHAVRSGGFVFLEIVNAKP